MPTNRLTLPDDVLLRCWGAAIGPTTRLSKAAFLTTRMKETTNLLHLCMYGGG